VEGRCDRHLFDRAVDLCSSCGCEFCADCLVYSFGAKKPPFCLPCAVSAGGVRQGAGRKADRKAAKSFLKRREEFLAQREHGSTVKAPMMMDDSWMAKLDEPATREYPGVVDASTTA
jgi:hypothetical protein